MYIPTDGVLRPFLQKCESPNKFKQVQKSPDTHKMLGGRRFKRTAYNSHQKVALNDLLVKKKIN